MCEMVCSWGWTFLCESQISPYVSRVESGINTGISKPYHRHRGGSANLRYPRNSVMYPSCTQQGGTRDQSHRIWNFPWLIPNSILLA